jgi:hypothetical protein
MLFDPLDDKGENMMHSKNNKNAQENERTSKIEEKEKRTRGECM